MTTDHPVAHSTEAVAAPMPDPPPVIRATGGCERSTSTGTSVIVGEPQDGVRLNRAGANASMSGRAVPSVRSARISPIAGA